MHRGPITVVAGKQFIRWGKADILNPTDRFAPRDFMEVVDNEFLGSIRLPAAATGRRIDFRLDEECLLKVSFDDPEKGMTEVELATRDTPDGLKKALAEDARRRQGTSGGAGDVPGEERKGGIFGWLKRS